MLAESVALGESVTLDESVVLAESVALGESVALAESVVLDESVPLAESVALGESVVLAESIVLTESVVLAESVTLDESVELDETSAGRSFGIGSVCSFFSIVFSSDSGFDFASVIVFVFSSELAAVASVFSSEVTLSAGFSFDVQLPLIQTIMFTLTGPAEEWSFFEMVLEGGIFFTNAVLEQVENIFMKFVHYYLTTTLHNSFPTMKKPIPNVKKRKKISYF